MFLVKETEDIQSVALYLLYRVSIESQGAQDGQLLELLHLFKVRDVVAMQIQSFQAWEADYLSLDGCEIVVGKIEPLYLVRLPHNIVKDVS